MVLKKWTINFRFERSLWEDRTTFSDVPLLPEISVGTTQNVVCHLISNRILRKPFVNCKQPLFYLLVIPNSTNNEKKIDFRGVLTQLLVNQ